MIIRSQCIRFMMIQTIAICCNAGHKDVALQAITHQRYCCFDMMHGGATLKVICIIEYSLESLVRQNFTKRFRIISISLKIGNLLPVRMFILTVKKRYIVASFNKLRNK